MSQRRNARLVDDLVRPPARAGHAALLTQETQKLCCDPDTPTTLPLALPPLTPAIRGRASCGRSATPRGFEPLFLPVEDDEDDTLSALAGCRLHEDALGTRALQRETNGTSMASLFTVRPGYACV
jgi:hypothetical protein